MSDWKKIDLVYYGIRCAVIPEQATIYNDYWGVLYYEYKGKQYKQDTTISNPPIDYKRSFKVNEDIIQKWESDRYDCKFKGELVE